MKSLILICSLFVIGVFAGPIDLTKNELDSDVTDSIVYTWPAVKGIVYQMNITESGPEMGVKIIDKSLDNNPEGSTLFLKSKSIKFNSKKDVKSMQNMDFATLLMSQGSKIQGENHHYNFNDNILKITVPDVLTIEIKVLSDASFQTTVAFDDDEDLIETSCIASIMDFSETEYYRNEDPTFGGRIMVENPEISLDFYATKDDDFKFKFNAKDVIFDTADMENSFPLNLLKEYEETNKFPLTIVMAINKV